MSLITNYQSHGTSRTTLSQSHPATSTVQARTGSEDDAEGETDNEDDDEISRDDYESTRDKEIDDEEVEEDENQFSDASDTDKSSHDEISQSVQLDADWPPQGPFDF